MQPEKDHDLRAGRHSYVSDALGVNGREARKQSYFSFEMKVDPTVNNQLLLTYIGDDKNRKFDIIAEGVKLATEQWEGGETGRFYNKTYPLPVTLIAGKTKIRVSIEANYDKTAGRVFGVRTIK